MVMGASFKVQKDSPSISLMHHMLIYMLWKHWFQSAYFLCCTRLFHGVCFHSCLSDNHLAPQPSCFFGAKDRWLVNRLLVDMRKTIILLVKWTRRASLCPTTLTRRGMIGDRPIGSLLRSSPDGPGKRTQRWFLCPFEEKDVRMKDYQDGWNALSSFGSYISFYVPFGRKCFIWIFAFCFINLILNVFTFLHSVWWESSPGPIEPAYKFLADCDDCWGDLDRVSLIDRGAASAPYSD